MSTDGNLRPFSLKELAEILVRHQGLHDGLYDLAFEVSVGFGGFGPTKEESLPGAVFGIKAVGLTRVSEIGPHTVDAATVNPMPGKRPQRRSAQKKVVAD